MRIHLTGSSTHLEQDLQYFRAIIKIVHSLGGSILHNWIEAANYRAKHNTLYDHSEWSDIVANNVDAISRADAVIIEGSNYHFFQGFQTAFALQRRCPVLYLTRNDFSHRAISGIRSPLFTVKGYKTEADLKKIISDYFKANGTMHVEVKIDERNYTFLRGEALLSGKTESDIINELITEKLEK